MRFLLLILSCLMLSSTARTDDTVRLRLVSKRHAPLPSLQQGRTLTETHDSSRRSWRIVSLDDGDLPGLLEKLKYEPDLEWVERAIPIQPENEKSSWLVQSGEDRLGRTLWARGLTGLGQIGAVADTGLDIDACQFRYGPEADQVTWPTEDVWPPAAHVSDPTHKIIAYYVLDGADAYDEAASGFHGSHTTGTMAGDDYASPCSAEDVGADRHDGMAPCAQVVFQDIGSAEGTLTGLDRVSQYDMLLQAHRSGARAHNNSYGRVEIVTHYEADSASIDEAAWRLNDLLVVHSAGNSGEMDKPGTLTGLGATAKNTLVVGASGPVELNFFGSLFALQDDLLFFSSQGPTADGRIKPDLVAPGMVFSATADLATVIDQGCCDSGGHRIRVSNPEDDNCNTDEDWPSPGTSFSAPMSAGVALLLRQHFTEGHWHEGRLDEEGRARPDPEHAFNPTSALLKACLLNGAAPLAGIIWLHNTPLGPAPSGAQGWGRIKLADSLSYRADERQVLLLADVPNPAPDNPMLDADAPLPPFAPAEEALRNDEQVSFLLPWAEAGSLLKVHLVWADPPGQPGSGPALVNNLDLDVFGPGGERYVGNLNFDDAGESQATDTTLNDSINNAEGVVIQVAETGRYLIRVTARSVGGVPDLEGSEAQGYALVASAVFAPPTATASEPATLEPGTQVDELIVRGQHIPEAPDLLLDLGPGISYGELEWIDAETLRLLDVQVERGAETGPRAIEICVHGKVCGRAEELLQVEEASGCACASSRNGGGLFLLLILALLNRRVKR